MKNNSVVIFSRQLSAAENDVQQKALHCLRDFVRSTAGVWQYKEEAAIDKAFAMFFDGSYKEYAIFAEVEKIPFQIEVIRGDLSSVHERAVRQIGFEVIECVPVTPPVFASP